MDIETRNKNIIRCVVESINFSSLKEHTIFVCATVDELKLIESILKNDFMNLTGYSIIVTGVGPTNVIKNLINVPKDSLIVNVGYAGSKNLPVGSWQIVRNAHLYHDECEYTEPISSSIISIMFASYYTDENLICNVGATYDCYSSCDFVTKSDRENCLFDMELAFIAHMGFKRVIGVKVVSDNLDYNEYEKSIK